MGYDIYLINEEKKEIVRTKANGEDKNFIIKFLSDNQGQTFKIRGEDSAEVWDIIYDDTLKGYKQIDITT
jgi:hypothetical protein